jgi:hypothetical protein
VDGVDEAVPGSPVNSWVQISGADGSTGQIVDFSTGGGTVTNYYKDDSNFDGNDTGDQKSFADAGIGIDNPTGISNLRFTEFILDAAQPNVRSEYRTLYDNPFEMAVQAQTLYSVYLPIVLR